MPPADRFKLRRPALVAAILSALVPGAAIAAAGRVDFSIGDVRAVNSGGVERVLKAGAEVDSGDTVRTTNGRAHIRFTDGAYVSLKPNTEFRVDKYRFDGSDDGQERGFFSLLRGGLRTITGLIGHRNRDAYRMTTAVASIGIRGTHYSLDVGTKGPNANPMAHIANYRDSATITVSYNPVLTLPSGLSMTVTRVGGTTLIEIEDPSTGEKGLYQLVTTETDAGKIVNEFVFLGEGADLLGGIDPSEIDLGLSDILKNPVETFPPTPPAIILS